MTLPPSYNENMAANTDKSKTVYASCRLDIANNFVQSHHRHSLPVVGHKFSIAALQNEKLIGVAIIGRPVARMLDNGTRLEILRVCTDGTKNICSGLYSRAAKAAFAMGYKEIITYIREDEHGSSVKAAGFEIQGYTKPDTWNRKSRHRETRELIGKIRYGRISATNATETDMKNLEEYSVKESDQNSLFF